MYVGDVLFYEPVTLILIIILVCYYVLNNKSVLSKGITQNTIQKSVKPA